MRIVRQGKEDHQYRTIPANTDLNLADSPTAVISFLNRETETKHVRGCARSSWQHRKQRNCYGPPLRKREPPRGIIGCQHANAPKRNTYNRTALMQLPHQRNIERAHSQIQRLRINVRAKLKHGQQHQRRYSLPHNRNVDWAHPQISTPTRGIVVYSSYS